MAILSDVQRAALGYWWNLVSDAALSGATVTETVQAANSIAREMGQGLSPEMNRAISSLYGYARRGVNSSNVLTAATEASYINSDMMSVAPYARDEQERNTYPIYHVKFEYTYIDQAGNEQTTYRTSAIEDGLPGTVGELQQYVQDDAEGMAAKYGHQLISANLFQILAV